VASAVTAVGTEAATGGGPVTGRTCYSVAIEGEDRCVALRHRTNSDRLILASQLPGSSRAVWFRNGRPHGPSRLAPPTRLPSTSSPKRSRSFRATSSGSDRHRPADRPPAVNEAGSFPPIALTVGKHDPLRPGSEALAVRLAEAAARNAEAASSCPSGWRACSAPRDGPQALAQLHRLLRSALAPIDDSIRNSRLYRSAISTEMGRADGYENLRWAADRRRGSS
jgi:hypothetical protein